MIYKSLIKLVLLCCIVLGLNANEIKLSPSYKEALAQAKKENKKLIMYMYSDHCPWCTKMKKDTLSNKEVIKYVNENYIFVKINIDSDDYPQVFRAKGIPTTYLINSKMESKIITMRGYKSPGSFLDRLELSNE